MFKFLSQILKQKKILIFIFLFLVLLGVIIPQLTIASSWNPWNPEFYLTDDGQLTGLGSAINLEFGEAIMVPFAATALAIGVALVVVFGTLSTLAGTLLTKIIAMDVGCYTCMSNPAIAAGWPAVRDLANMVVVLGFVVIGIATTLRFNEYGAKKLLPNLIIAALLINFSLIISGIFIDGSNIAAKSFNKSGGFFERSWGQTIGDQTSKIWAEWKGKSYKEAAVGILSAATGLTFYNIMAIVIFFLYAFLYLFRHMALWILVILSPLAFVCYVFPATKKFFNMWWSNFFNWCIIVVPISFFVWIADTIMAATQKSIGANSPPILSYLIPGTFMLIGFIFSLKISAMGASSAIGLAKGAIGLSGKAGMGTLKMAGRESDRLTGGKVSEAGRKISSGVGHTLEKLGFRDEGITAMNKNAAAKKEEARYEALFGENPEALKNIVRGKGEGKNSRKRAAAAKVALKNDVFDTTDNAMVNALPHFSAHGYSIAEHTKKDPNMAQYDPNITGPMIKAGMSQDVAATAAVRNATNKMGVDAAGNLSAGNLTPEVASAFNVKKAKRLGEKGSEEAIEKMKKYKDVTSPEYVAAEQHITDTTIAGSAERIKAFDQFDKMIAHITSDAAFA